MQQANNYQLSQAKQVPAALHTSWCICTMFLNYSKRRNRLVCLLCSRQWSINVISFSHFLETFIISNWCKHRARHQKGRKSRLAMQDYLQKYLVQVWNTVRCIKFHTELDFCGSPGPVSPGSGSTVFTYPAWLPLVFVCIVKSMVCFNVFLYRTFCLRLAVSWLMDGLTVSLCWLAYSIVYHLHCISCIVYLLYFIL